MSRTGGAGRKKDSLLEAIQARAKELDSEASHIATPEKPILKAVTKFSKSDLLRIEDAYVRLEITKEQVEAFPNITNALADIGGVPAVLEYLKSSDAKEAKELLRHWDQSTAIVRELLPFEAFVVAAKCSRKRMLQIIIGEVSEQSSAEAVLLAAVKHKEVVQKTVNVALSDNYGADSARKMLLQHRKFLPLPKNQVVNVKDGNFIEDNSTHQEAHFHGSMDDARERIGRANDRFNKTRQLPEHVESFVEDED